MLSSKNSCAADIISPAETKFYQYCREETVKPKMITEVVPSPHSSSCVREISIMDLAAGCLTIISRKIAFPSLVTTIPPFQNGFNVTPKDKNKPGDP